MKKIHAFLFGCLLLLAFAAPAAASVVEADRVVFLVLDGARMRTFDEMLKGGELPRLADLAARGALVERAVGAFPSTTGPAYAPFVTGGLTGKSHLPGIRWFDRARGIYRVYCGTDTGGAIDADLNPDLKTVYELLPPTDSLSVFGFIERGCRQKTTPFLNLAVPKLTGDFHAMDRALFDVFWKAYRDFGFPRFAFLSLHAPDSEGHANGPDGDGYRATLRLHDALVGELVDRMKGEGIFAGATFLVTADHGIQAASQGVDLRAELERVFGLKVWNSVPRVSQTFNLKNRLGLAKFDAIFAVSGNAFVMVYVKAPGASGMEAKPSYDQLRAYPVPGGAARDLPAALLGIAAVRTVLLAEGPGVVRCIGRGGESRIETVAGGLRYKVLSGSDPFGYEPLGVYDRTLSPTKWLDATCRTPWPDAPVQIASLFAAPGTGDLVFISEIGHEPWNEGQKGVHGSLHEDQNVVPFLVCGPRVKPGITLRAARTADLFPLSCELLGLPVPEGIDGRTLPLFKEKGEDEPALPADFARVAVAVSRETEKALLVELAQEKKAHDKSLTRFFRAESPRYVELRGRLSRLWDARRGVDAGSSRAASALVGMALYADGKSVETLRAEVASRSQRRGFSLAGLFKAPFEKKAVESLARSLTARLPADAAARALLATLPAGTLAQALDPATLSLLTIAPASVSPAARPVSAWPADLAALAEPAAAETLSPAAREAYALYVSANARLRALADGASPDPDRMKAALDDLAAAKARYDEELAKAK